jgi:hypothetical protein
MKKKIIPVFLLLFFAAGCASVKESEKVADKFYNATKSKNYDMIIPLLDDEAIKATPGSVWVKVVKQKEGFYGDLVSYKQTSFETNAQDNATFVILKFTVINTKKTSFEKIIFIKRNETYKIYNYKYNQTETERDQDQD